MKLRGVSLDQPLHFISVAELPCDVEKFNFTMWTRSNANVGLMRNDTIQWTIFSCAQKLTNSQLNLPYGTGPNKKSNEETKNQKPRCSEETVQS